MYHVLQNQHNQISRSVLHVQNTLVIAIDKRLDFIQLVFALLNGTKPQISHQLSNSGYCVTALVRTGTTHYS